MNTEDDELGEEPLLLRSPFAVTGEAIFYNTLSSMVFSTGIHKLDILLEGGLYPGDLIEIYGKSKSGKTQLCHKIVSSISLHQCSAFYIDLHNDFSALRCLQLGQPTNINYISEKIIVARPFGIEKLLRTLDQIETELTDGKLPLFHNLKLVIIDALPFTLYPLMEPGMSSRNVQECIVQTLRRLATVYGVTFIIVNHSVTTSFDTRLINGGGDILHQWPSVKPALGKYWKQVPNIRISLARIDDAWSLESSSNCDSFRAILEKSGRGETQRYFDFTITDTDII